MCIYVSLYPYKFTIFNTFWNVTQISISISICYIVLGECKRYLLVFFFESALPSQWTWYVYMYVYFIDEIHCNERFHIIHMYLDSIFVLMKNKLSSSFWEVSITNCSIWLTNALFGEICYLWCSYNLTIFLQWYGMTSMNNDITSVLCNECWLAAACW